MATRSSNTFPSSTDVPFSNLAGVWLVPFSGDPWAWSEGVSDRHRRVRVYVNPRVPSGPVGLRITSILRENNSAVNNIVVYRSPDIVSEEINF